MPASTAKPTGKTDIQINDAMSRARAKVEDQFRGTNFYEIVALACKMMEQNTREELKQ